MSRRKVLVLVAAAALVGAGCALALAAVLTDTGFGALVGCLVVVGLALAAVVALELARVVRGQGARIATLERAVKKSLAASARDQALVAGAARKATADAKPGLVDVIGKQTRRSLAKEFRQVDALLQLNRLAPVREALPASRGWAASPDVLLTLVALVRERRPRLVVDLGSGLSTVYVAAALEALGTDGRVVSIDHDAHFAELTRELLVRQGLSERAEVRIAELTDLELEGETWPWYAIDGLADLTDVDLLFIDGPPGTIRPESRYPALPVLAARLAADAVVVIDDYARPDERTMVARWMAADPRWRLEELRHEKGAAVLRRSVGE